MAKTLEKFSTALSWVISENKILQKELADDVGVSRTSITDYKQGKREGDEDTRKRIATALGYDYQEFLELGEWIVEGNDGKDFKVCKNKTINQAATENARQQAHTGAGNTSMFDRDGLSLTGYDQRNPPPAVDADAWAELMHWIIKHPSMVPSLATKARELGGAVDAALGNR